MAIATVMNDDVQVAEDVRCKRLPEIFDQFAVKIADLLAGKLGLKDQEISPAQIDSNRGRAVTVYSENCLRREGFNYRLPDCARSVRIYGKRDRVYSEQCLRDAGFRTRGRR